MAANRIRVSGDQRTDFDVDLLLQAVLVIAEEQLRAQQVTDPGSDTDADDDSERA